MKRLCILSVLAFLLIINPPELQSKRKPANLEEAQKAVNLLMDNFADRLKARNAGELAELLSEDGRYYGTDPGELLCKLAMYDTWSRQFADNSQNLDYTVDKRYIRVSPDGNSALVVEQFTLRQYTPNIPWRMISHAVKTGRHWKLDFISWNLTPKNEDIAKLNKALE